MRPHKKTKAGNKKATTQLGTPLYLIIEIELRLSLTRELWRKHKHKVVYVFFSSNIITTLSTCTINHRNYWNLDRVSKKTLLVSKIHRLLKNIKITLVSISRSYYYSEEASKRTSNICIRSSKPKNHETKIYYTNVLPIRLISKLWAWISLFSIIITILLCLNESY